ncbi:hypothetical protein GWK47_029873 [Chionoecetes opilio]|uniref:Uncharacterized protein n=1 Tax=Chionoecetes opilio TaxID=41210 RepID=A0A8J4YXS6_CHIOP|nr:hypothetical protein GWK47_029873 [Chionoecetes opilio]
MDVELKNVAMKDEQLVCVVGNRSPRGGTKRRHQESEAPHQGKRAKVTTMSQSDVHRKILLLAKKMRLARRRRHGGHKGRCGAHNDPGAWKEGGGDLVQDGFGDDFEDTVGDDNLEEDLREWNVSESGDAGKKNVEKELRLHSEEEELLELDGKFLSDDETYKTHTIEEEENDDEDEADDGDGLMAILKTVPKPQTISKTKRVKSTNNRARARRLSDMEERKRLMKEKKRKLKQVEEERYRHVMFSQTLEFQQQEAERKKQAEGERMLRDCDDLDGQFRQLLDDLQEHDADHSGQE